ncbi:MAT2A [Symbiodinium sp. KB8]|nr:MAT2A [Symbiodinium sp. KB8]
MSISVDVHLLSGKVASIVVDADESVESLKRRAQRALVVLKIEFDCRPGAIAQSLALREPKYQETAAYCHFGREPVTKDGIKFFEWENPKDLSKYTAMNTAQVDAALKGSTYLAKWVD